MTKRPHTAHDGRTCRLVRVRLTPDEYERVKRTTTTDSRREILLAGRKDDGCTSARVDK